MKRTNTASLSFHSPSTGIVFQFQTVNVWASAYARTGNNGRPVNLARLSRFAKISPHQTNNGTGKSAWFVWNQEGKKGVKEKWMGEMEKKRENNKTGPMMTSSNGFKTKWPESVLFNVHCDVQLGTWDVSDHYYRFLWNQTTTTTMKTRGRTHFFRLSYVSRHGPWSLSAMWPNHYDL